MRASRTRGVYVAILAYRSTPRSARVYLATRTYKKRTRLPPAGAALQRGEAHVENRGTHLRLQQVVRRDGLLPAQPVRH